MELVKKIVERIQALNSKNFYTYFGTFYGAIVALSLLLIIRYYTSAHSLTEQTTNVNEQRIRMRELLSESQQVQKQKTEVNKMIEQEEDFNIIAYFLATLVKLALNDSLVTTNNTRTDREDNYSEEELKAQLQGLNMKQLTELLQEIEQNKRIYSKELEIVKSKKRPNTIEVNITIATLIKKTTATTG